MEAFEQNCPACQTRVATRGYEPLGSMTCPHCGRLFVVHGRIAHFDLLAVAGRGGMGVVYKALDTSLQRLVAIKLLRKEHSDQTARIAQLEKEAAITAAIHHPHVVKVFSTGIDHGRFFLAMELVEHGSLDDLIRAQGRIAESQALEAAIQCARGLSAAHQHGLIHRDVKPGNILFADPATAKIVDFGLAIFVDQEESARGEIWGTPYYVAPEKLDEQREDFRSDIYSLGATIFHALAGRPPFEAENASMVAFKHLKSQPVSLQAFAPHVSGATAYVINRTLLKDPDQRYQSYEELIEHFQYARSELANAAHSPQKVKRVVIEDEVEQQTWGWLSGAMLGAVVVLAIVALFLHSRMAPERRGKPTPAASTTNTTPASDPTVFQAARAKLIAGEAEAAAELFRQVGARREIGQFDREWAQLQEALALFVAGRPADAEKTLATLGAPGATPGGAEAAKPGTFFARVASKMGSGNASSTGDEPSFNPNNYEAIGLLLVGLKNWSAGEVREAAVWFRKFRAARPSGKDEWIARLKRFASERLEQFTAVEMLGGQLQSAGSPEERTRFAEKLQAVDGVLAPRAREFLVPFEKELAELDRKRAQPPSDGRYKLINRKSGKCIDVAAHRTDDGAKVHQWENTSSGNQQWDLTARKDGSYSVIARHSRKALDAASDGTGTGDASVRQWSENSGEAQRWRIENADGRYFRIIAAKSGKVLSVANDSSENGGAIVQLPYAGAPSQQWELLPIGGRAGEWDFEDVGDSGAAGTTEAESKRRFVLKASGHDVWGSSDGFHFTSRALTGDFELVVRVDSLTRTHEWAKAGLMARETMNANARNVFVALTAANGATQQVRAATNAETTSTPKPEAKIPGWLKLRRRGNQFTGFYSVDGKGWQQIAQDNLGDLPSTLHVGLAATSHVPGEITTVRFADLALLQRR